ncbi:MAG: glycerol-3-phosphate 1-O-acyltransferase PlsB, partial [Pseudomonadales bacterium]|nr:glycerol-3-phosphate 1-O-acyltransferase PlsB [Pseudomonadales bacterium]
LRRVLGVLFDRTHLFVRFGPPLRLTDIVTAVPEDAIARRRIARLLRTQFRQAREALIGPDLSHRRTLVNRVVAARSVRRAAAELAEAENMRASKAIARARRYAQEIASDLSFTAIRFFDVLLTWLWTRLYDGIDIRGLEGVKAIAGDHTLIYVPSHRSHVDYLLLSYVLFYNGLMLPHVAAGRNLNIPVVGPLLRRSGAFFMRRSFRGDPLYSAVFEEYLDRVFDTGSSVEYFVEGGRSRTGRLLPARAGMLGMTVRARLRSTGRPFAFVPVYFGYEKVVEARSYLGELRGEAKRQESLGGVLRSVRFLRQSFGTVHVGFGRPLILDDALDAAVPDWRETRGEALRGDRDWLHGFVDQLGTELQVRVNAAAIVTPVALTATALLATERQALDEDTLLEQIACLLTLARRATEGGITVTDRSPEDIVAYGERLGLLERTAHPLGDILSAGPTTAVLLTWYRNNVIHVFAAPALIAAILSAGRSMSREALLDQAATVLPYLRRELFLPGADGDERAQLTGTLRALAAEGLLTEQDDRVVPPARGTAAFARLHRLALVITPTLERWYIAVALLDGQPPHSWTTEALEQACVLTARRMARLYGIDAPEFFDATLFRQFIAALGERGVVVPDDAGRLDTHRELRAVMVNARRVLDPAFCDGVRAARQLPALSAPD